MGGLKGQVLHDFSLSRPPVLNALGVPEQGEYLDTRRTLHVNIVSVHAAKILSVGQMNWSSGKCHYPNIGVVVSEELLTERES